MTPFLAEGSYPTPACFPPKALVLSGGWWVLRPTSPGTTSRELGEALTLGVSWGRVFAEQLCPLLLSHWL